MSFQGSFELIESFVIVAEELNFRRSAERMNIDQSALSKRIRKLEEMLGFPLFERTTHDVSLTPAGRTFYDENTHLLAGYSNAIEKARLIAEGKTGALRIAHMNFVVPTLVPETVALFHEKYPYVDIRLIGRHTLAQRIELANDKIDLGYMIGPFDHSEFHSIPVKQDPLYVVMPPGHKLAEKDELLPADLADVDLILGDRNKWGFYRQRLDELFNGEGVPLQCSFDVANTLAIVGLVTAKLGVTIFPKSLAEFLSSGVELRPIKHSDFSIQLILAYRRTNRTEVLRNYVKVAKKISLG